LYKKIQKLEKLSIQCIYQTDVISYTKAKDVQWHTIVYVYTLSYIIMLPI